MDENLHTDEENLLSYADGEMSDQERRDFELRLKEEPHLRDKLHRLQMGISAVRQYGAAEKVKRIHGEMIPGLKKNKKGKVVSMSRFIKYSMAAAAGIIILVVAIKLVTANSVSAVKLYSDAYVSYDAGTVRGGSTPSALEEAYQSGNYDRVTDLAANGANLSSRDSLLTGIAFLNQDKSDSAARWLTGPSRQGTYRQDAEFYLALAWLKSKNYTAAVRLMKKIRNEEGHIYREQFSEEYVGKVERLRE